MASRARSARLRSTTLGCLREGELALGAVKDRVEVLLDGKLLGISGRPTNGAAISLKIPQGKHRLDLLVEIMGRINYGKFMLEERKGLAAPVLFAGKELSPCDTWLEMRGFGRGMVWFNGRNLGRYWKAGPSQTIFLLGCWMKRDAENEIVVLEMGSENCPAKVATSTSR